MEAASNPETGRVLSDIRLVLLFDGTCGPCTRAAQWVRRHDSAGHIVVLPNQAPGVLADHGLTRAEADRSAWAFEPGGRRREGAAALNRVLEELGGGWRLLALPYRPRLLAAAEEAAYRWFAANRGRFAWLGVTPECERPGVACAD
jgi:predicted DCC family thiol-disulfide oxidoreductase YuxK